jgi:hypothetical protein
MKNERFKIGEIVKNYWKGNGILALVINEYISNYKNDNWRKNHCNYYSVLNLSCNFHIDRLIHPSFLKKLK